MKKIIKLLILLFTIFSTSVGYSDWLIAVNNAENVMVVSKTNKKAVCYNKQTGTRYMSLSKAVSMANSNESIYVIPGSVINISTNLTIPVNVNVYLPYEGEICNITKDNEIIGNGPLGDSNQNNVKTNRVSLVNLIFGADLIINGSLTIGSIFTSNGVRTKYCELNLGENSSVICNGSLTCYGYIKEEASTAKNSVQSQNINFRKNEFDSGRKVVINNGARLTATMSIFDMKSGGEFTTLDSNGICPFNYINFTNIQSYLEIKHGAFFDAEAHIEIAGQKAIVKVNIIRPSSSKESSLYYTNEGSLNIEYCPKNVNYTGTRDDLNIFVDGNVKQGFLEIKSALTIKTSNYFLPMSECFNIYILNNGVFNCDYRIKFLPSSQLVIDSGGIFNLNSELAIYRSDSASLPTLINDGTCSHLMGKKDALFINNGILNVNANAKIGGDILTEVTNDTAQIVFSSTCLTEVSSKEGKSGDIIKLVSSGLFKNNGSINSAQFISGTTVISDIAGGKCWIGESLSVFLLEINVDKTGISNAITNYRVYIADDENGTNTKELTTQSMQDSSNYQINSNKYFKVILVDYVSATLNSEGQESIQFESNKWYLLNTNYQINIIPNEAVKLIFGCVAVEGGTLSGNSNTVFTVSVSDTQNGTYTDLPTQKGSGNFNLPKNKWFKFTISPGFGTQGQLKVVSSKIEKGPAELVGTECLENHPYPASGDYKFQFTLKASGCVNAGSNILMGDGTYKKVEDVQIDDIIMAFNHETGKYEPTPLIAIIKHKESQTRVTILTFDDGSKLEIIGLHDLFDYTLKQYVTLAYENCDDFLNHEFASYDNGKLSTKRLVNIDYRDEYTTAYMLVTYEHKNFIAEDILTGDSNSNYFDFDENLKYNEITKQQDIDEFGLIKYEDVQAIVPEFIYDGFNIKYYNVLLGKGLITEEHIKEWLDVSNYLIECGELQFNPKFVK